MTPPRSLLAPAALALVLVLPLSACSGDDEPDADTGSSSQTDEGAAPDDAAPEEAAPEDAEAPAGGVTFVDTTEPAAVVMIGADGFSPLESTVAVGEVVVFTADDDGTYSVIVSDLDGYTVTTGLDEYFRFDQPGAYPVTEDISGAEMTVIVEE